MSHCRASSLYDHLDHCFVVLKHIQQRFLMRNWTFEGTRSTFIKTLNVPRSTLVSAHSGDGGLVAVPVPMP